MKAKLLQILLCFGLFVAGLGLLSFAQAQVTASTSDKHMTSQIITIHLPQQERVYEQKIRNLL